MFGYEGRKKWSFLLCWSIRTTDVILKYELIMALRIQKDKNFSFRCSVLSNDSCTIMQMINVLDVIRRQLCITRGSCAFYRRVAK